MLDKTLPEPRTSRWPIVAAFVLVMIAAALIAVRPLMSAEVGPPPVLRAPDAPAPVKAQTQRAAQPGPRHQRKRIYAVPPGAL